MTTRNTIAEYIKKADYPALVSEANKNQAKVLKYVQSYIYRRLRRSYPLAGDQRFRTFGTRVR